MTKGAQTAWRERGTHGRQGDGVSPLEGLGDPDDRH